MTESILIVYKCPGNAVHKRKCLTTGQTSHKLVQMGSTLSQLNIYQQHVGGSKWKMTFPCENKYFDAGVYEKSIQLLYLANVCNHQNYIVQIIFYSIVRSCAISV